MESVLLAINRKQRKTDTVAAWCGFIWFNLIIDACYTWFLPTSYRLFFGFFFVIIGSALLASEGGVKMRKQDLGMILPLLVFMIFLLFVKRVFPIIPLIKYIPLFCMVCWRKSALLRLYDLVKKYIVFYAIVSIFVELFVFSGLWIAFPHLVFPPQDDIQESLGLDNYFYGFFCIPYDGSSMSFYRACGPLREGGHFSLFLGIVYFTEKVLHNRRNLWLLFCGLLTLSPNFLLIFIITELYVAKLSKHIFKVLGGAIGIVALVVFSFYFSPQSVKDEIVRIVLERSLERNIENMGDEGFMALIDGRASYNGLMLYDTFTKSDIFTKVVGFPDIGEDYTMSDFRYVLIRFGFGGMFLYLLSFYMFTVKREPNLYGICVLAIVLIAFIQRAWMFNDCFFWLLMLLVLNKKYCVNSNTYGEK